MHMHRYIQERRAKIQKLHEDRENAQKEKAQKIIEREGEEVKRKLELTAFLQRKYVQVRVLLSCVYYYYRA
jgi:hypothetical protein